MISARLAADAVVVLHLAFILFAVFGGLLALKNPRWLAPHLPALAWGLWIEASHGRCPLTGIENRLLAQAGEAGYEGGFIEHYLLPLIYPPGLDAQDQILIALVFVVWSLAIYALIWRRWHRSK